MTNHLLKYYGEAMINRLLKWVIPTESTVLKVVATKMLMIWQI